MISRTFGEDSPPTVDDFRAGSGSPNSGPRIGPVVVHEIMYRPPDLPGPVDNERDEYIELRNITGQTVLLYDPNYPTNRWRLRDAVDFVFPPNTTLPAGGTLLVVSFDPVSDPVSRAAFEAAYGLTTAVPMVGPYSGKLNNSDDEVELYKPDPPQIHLPSGDPDHGLVPYVLVEKVEYFDTLPWPTSADGFGLSLQRIDANAFGNDVIHWTAATPTPGPQGSPTDQDGDGMPNDWEILYGLNPNNANDADRDGDGDGATNLEEYQAGTNPNDSNSVLRLILVGLDPVLLEFVAEADRGYTVEYPDTLNPGGPWQVLTSIAPDAEQQTIQVPDGTTSQDRFYRVRTP
jgi:hypothetical protein